MVPLAAARAGWGQVRVGRCSGLRLLLVSVLAMSRTALSAGVVRSTSMRACRQEGQKRDEDRSSGLAVVAGAPGRAAPGGLPGGLQEASLRAAEAVATPLAAESCWRQAPAGGAKSLEGGGRKGWAGGGAVGRAAEASGCSRSSTVRNFLGKGTPDGAMAGGPWRAGLEGGVTPKQPGGLRGCMLRRAPRARGAAADLPVPSWKAASLLGTMERAVGPSSAVPATVAGAVAPERGPGGAAAPAEPWPAGWGSGCQSAVLVAKALLGTKQPAQASKLRTTWIDGSSGPPSMPSLQRRGRFARSVGAGTSTA